MADVSTAPEAAPAITPEAPPTAPVVSTPQEAVPDATPDDMVTLLNHEEFQAAPYEKRVEAVNQIGQGIYQHLQKQPDADERTAEKFSELMAEAYSRAAPPKPEGIAGSVWSPIQEHGPSAVAGVVGGAGSAALASETGPVGMVAADIAGSAAASYGTQKAIDAFRGPVATRRAQEQLESNQKANPIASRIGEALPFVASMFTPVTAAQNSAKVANKVLQRIGKSAAGGAKAGGIAASRDYANGSSNLIDIPKEMVHNAATMAPLGFLGPAKNILTAMAVKAPSEAVIAATSEALYKRVVKGEPLDLSEITKGAVGDVPGFVLLNALSSALHSRAKVNAAASAPTSQAINGIVATATPGTSAYNRFVGAVGQYLGKTMSKTTARDRVAGELGARWLSSKSAAHLSADSFTLRALADSKIPVEKFGAALVEDNLRSIKDGLTQEGKTAEAAKVESIIGAKSSPFQTENDYQGFLASPAVKDALERHKTLWESTIDPMYRNAANIDPAEALPTRGFQTGARINLFNDPETKGSLVTGNPSNNATNTFRKRSPFARQAKGTGRAYNINYADMMRNTFGRQLEIANKNAFEKRMVASGNAVEDRPGKQIVLADGEATTPFALNRTMMVNSNGGMVPLAKNIYIRKSLAGEYERAADLNSKEQSGVLRYATVPLNHAALTGITDGAVHVTNLTSALLTRPAASGSVVTDTLLSAFARADIPVTIFQTIAKVFQETKFQTAKLAQIGAMKNQAPHSSWNPLSRWMGHFIQTADKITRLKLDDMFTQMVKDGLVVDTETNRREFVNTVGQYNLRAQGVVKRFMRVQGIAPFVTAGTNFAVQSARTLALRSGVPAASWQAEALLTANMLSKWIGAAAITGTLNYLLTRDKDGGAFGRPGIPLGRIDTGLNDENGNPLSFPFFDLIGLGRPMRVFGVRGFVESKRKGLNLQNSVEAAVRDTVNSNLTAWTGPVIRFGSIATTGHNPGKDLPRESRVVAPGESQTWENFKTALIDANPILKSAVLSQEPGKGWGAALNQQIPRFSLVPSQPPAMMADYPAIVRRAQAAQFIDDVIGRARKMNMQDRINLVNESLNRLDPADRAHAIRTLKERRIFTR